MLDSEVHREEDVKPVLNSRSLAVPKILLPPTRSYNKPPLAGCDAEDYPRPPGDMASKRNLSVLLLDRSSGGKFSGLWQHSLQCLKVNGSVLGHCRLDS